MRVLIGSLGLAVAAFMFLMSAAFWSMFRKGKAPESSKLFCVHHAAFGLAAIVLSTLYLARTLPDYPLTVTFAIISIGFAVVGRFLRSKQKIAGK